jgi:hypothetical protein
LGAQPSEPAPTPDDTSLEAEQASTETAGPVDPTAQPIDFSHEHHVTEIGIDCQFCHAYARRGPVAGIP